MHPEDEHNSVCTFDVKEHMQCSLHIKRWVCSGSRRKVGSRTKAAAAKRAAGKENRSPLPGAGMPGTAKAVASLAQQGASPTPQTGYRQSAGSEQHVVHADW